MAPTIYNFIMGDRRNVVNMIKIKRRAINTDSHVTPRSLSVASCILLRNGPLRIDKILFVSVIVCVFLSYPFGQQTNLSNVLVMILRQPEFDPRWKSHQHCERSWKPCPSSGRCRGQTGRGDCWSAWGERLWQTRTWILFVIIPHALEHKGECHKSFLSLPSTTKHVQLMCVLVPKIRSARQGKLFAPPSMLNKWCSVPLTVHSCDSE